MRSPWIFGAECRRGRACLCLLSVSFSWARACALSRVHCHLASCALWRLAHFSLAFLAAEKLLRSGVLELPAGTRVRVVCGSSPTCAALHSGSSALPPSASVHPEAAASPPSSAAAAGAAGVSRPISAAAVCAMSPIFCSIRMLHTVARGTPIALGAVSTRTRICRFHSDAMVRWWR